MTGAPLGGGSGSGCSSLCSIVCFECFSECLCSIVCFSVFFVCFSECFNVYGRLSEQKCRWPSCSILPNLDQLRQLGVVRGLLDMREKTTHVFEFTRWFWFDILSHCCPI